MDKYFLDLNFEKSLLNQLFMSRKLTLTLLLVLFLLCGWLVTGNNDVLLEEFKEEMIDLGKMTYFLGMEIKQTQNEVFLCQKEIYKGNSKEI